jgi:hypothetical protein
VRTARASVARSRLIRAAVALAAAALGTGCAVQSGTMKAARGGALLAAAGGSAGARYFTASVLPQFQASQCAVCHDGITATAQIFQYDYSQPMLMAAGTTATSNPFIRKVANLTSHLGGDACVGLDHEPCLSLRTWWDTETTDHAAPASGGGSGSGGMTGTATVDPQTGLVTGYAYDTGNPSSSVQVELVVLSPPAAPATLGPVTADQRRLVPPYNAAFSFPLPPAYLDAKPRKLQVQVIQPGTGNRISVGGAIDLIAGDDAGGHAAFDARIKPQMSRCVQCHGSQWSDYYVARAVLSSPSPLDGGTATNNDFYRKASGGDSHRGGDVCAGTTLCQDIQAWYAADFGN